MAKGAVAKANAVSLIKKAFGTDYIGEFDKKVYIWADDGGERVQLAISMTCPKVQVGAVPATPIGEEGFNFEEEPTVAPTTFEPAEVTQEEIDNITELMKKLGL